MLRHEAHIGLKTFSLYVSGMSPASCDVDLKCHRFLADSGHHYFLGRQASMTLDLIYRQSEIAVADAI